MKTNWKIGMMVAAVAFGTTASVLAAEDVDFARVNPVLQSLVDTTVAGDDLVDYAQPKFDESFSDLKAEKLKYDLQGAMKNTPWLSGGKADVTATSTYVADRNPSHTGIQVQMGATVKTDVMALVRYTGKLGLEKSRGHSPKFAARIIDQLTRLSAVTSLTDLYSLIQSGQALALEILDDKITKEQNYLQCIQAGQCSIGNLSQAEAIAEQQKTIGEWQQVKAGYQSTQIQAVTQNGIVNQISISNADSSGFVAHRSDFTVKPGKATLVITNDVVQADLGAFASVSSARLDDLKSRLQARLVGAQNGNPADKDEIQAKFRQALIEFKRVAKGQNNY